ncbi:cytochrome C oxidase subunit IV family protein [Mycolicibacterium duvalii]|uniref:cytochrome C oxidase subunit IV family protein n=1 Tax=Mycolicibacterium duvalii TaxID=39688 RepID=UPI0027E341BA|nr:cytochrome C oxidase subunit IV family protein [Mycolicibacterium duvalii]
MTVVVLLIAAVKTQLVMWHFMEVRQAPRWLKVTTNGWLVVLFGALLGLYFSAV